MFYRGRHLLFFLTCMLAVFSTASAVSCRNVGSGGNFTVALGTVTVSRDITVGQVIKKVGPTNQVGYEIWCTPDSGADRDLTFTLAISREPAEGFTDVYPTNLAGVGARYLFASGNRGGVSDGLCSIDFEQSIPQKTFSVTCHLLHGSSETKTLALGTSVEFIKTGPITIGSLTTIPAVTVSMTRNNEAGTINFTNMYAGTATGTIGTRTCATPDVSVTMSSRRSSEFNGVGSTTPAKSFNLMVNDCPAGMSRIRYQFSPAAGVSASTDGTVPLDNASTATGIGMKLTDDNNVALAWNTWNVLTAYDATNGGSFAVPLKAAYIQTAATIGPGSANTSVLFTMSYE